MATRTPQPAAVAAARQMLEPRLQSIAAIARAHELLDQRRAEAAAAQAALTEAVTGYAERYAAARSTHGWTPAELGELGFPDDRPPAGGTRADRRHATPTIPPPPIPPIPPAPPDAAAGGAGADAATTGPQAHRGAAGHRPGPAEQYDRHLTFRSVRYCQGQGGARHARGNGPDGAAHNPRR